MIVMAWSITLLACGQSDPPGDPTATVDSGSSPLFPPSLETGQPTESVLTPTPQRSPPTADELKASCLSLRAVDSEPNLHREDAIKIALKNFFGTESDSNDHQGVWAGFGEVTNTGKCGQAPVDVPWDQGLGWIVAIDGVPILPASGITGWCFEETGTGISLIDDQAGETVHGLGSLRNKRAPCP